MFFSYLSGSEPTAGEQFQENDATLTEKHTIVFEKMQRDDGNISDFLLFLFFHYLRLPVRGMQTG